MFEMFGTDLIMDAILLGVITRFIWGGLRVGREGGCLFLAAVGFFGLGGKVAACFGLRKKEGRMRNAR